MHTKYVKALRKTSLPLPLALLPPPCQHFTAFAWARVAFALLLTQLAAVVVVVVFCVNISAPATVAA